MEMKRHLLKPNRLNNSWSSKQRLDREDRACLQDVLLAISIKLSKLDQNTMGIMTNTTYADLTQIISTRNMLKDILISLENE